jgi:hypothetical protein
VATEYGFRLADETVRGPEIMLAVIVLLGAFIHRNWGMPQFVSPAVALDVFAIAAFACLNLQIALVVWIDYGEPVATIQKNLELLRKLRIRYAQAIFLTITLTWLPVFVVLMKAALGVDVWRTFDRTSDLAGYNLNAASRFRADLARFEEEDPQV